MADLPAGKLSVEVVSGSEGPCLVLGDNDSGERIAGPKPWGGGSTLFSFTVDAGDLIRIGKEYACNARPVADAETLLSDYDDAVAALSAENDTGWDEGGCAAKFEQEVSRLRGLVLQRLQPQPSSAPVGECPDCTNGQQCDSCSRGERAVLASSAPAEVEGFDTWYCGYSGSGGEDDIYTLAQAAWRAALAQQPAAVDDVARLVDGKPSEPGIYAVQGFHYGHPEDHAIVEVIEQDGELMTNLHEANSDRHSWGRLSGCSEKFRWHHIAGPFTATQQEADHD